MEREVQRIIKAGGRAALKRIKSGNTTVRMTRCKDACLLSIHDLKTGRISFAPHVTLDQIIDYNVMFFHYVHRAPSGRLKYF